MSGNFGRQHIAERLIIRQSGGGNSEAYTCTAKNLPKVTFISSKTMSKIRPFITAHLPNEIGGLVNY